jgi:hypothetical protein
MKSIILFSMHNFKGHSTMSTPTKIVFMGVIFYPLVMMFTTNLVYAGGGSPPTGTTPTPDPINPITSTNPGIVQVANWGGSSNNLAPPNCNGGCFFAVTRFAPTNYGSNGNLEAIVGITLPIGSNDNGIGEVNRINAEMQKYRTENEAKLALSEKLAEALENCRTERSKIIAMMLAPMLGYRDYQLLLTAVTKPSYNQTCEAKSSTPVPVNPSVENPPAAPR